MEEKIWFLSEEHDDIKPLTFLKNNGEKAVYLWLHVRGGATRAQLVEGLGIGHTTVERAVKALSRREIIEGR